MRLYKVAKELNVGIANIVDFLYSKGIKIDGRPNSKISIESYDLIKQEFNKYKEEYKRAKEIYKARCNDSKDVNNKKYIAKYNISTSKTRIFRSKKSDSKISTEKLLNNILDSHSTSKLLAGKKQANTTKKADGEKLSEIESFKETEEYTQLNDAQKANIVDYTQDEQDLSKQSLTAARKDVAMALKSGKITQDRAFAMRVALSEKAERQKQDDEEKVQKVSDATKGAIKKDAEVAKSGMTKEDIQKIKDRVKNAKVKDKVSEFFKAKEEFEKAGVTRQEIEAVDQIGKELIKGLLKNKRDFKAGKLEGASKEFDENGRLNYEGEFKSGNQEGISVNESSNLDSGDIDIIEKAKRKIKENILDIEHRKDLTNDEKSELIIKLFSATCAAIAIQPIPFADFFVLTPIQAYMGSRLAAIRGLNIKEAEIKTILKQIASVIGLGLLAQQLVIGAYKTFIPFLGAFTTIPIVYGLTYAIGKTMDNYLLNKVKGVLLSKKQMKNIFDEMLKKGKNEGRKNKESIKNNAEKLN